MVAQSNGTQDSNTETHTALLFCVLFPVPPLLLKYAEPTSQPYNFNVLVTLLHGNGDTTQWKCLHLSGANCMPAGTPTHMCCCQPSFGNTEASRHELAKARKRMCSLGNVISTTVYTSHM